MMVIMPAHGVLLKGLFGGVCRYRRFYSTAEWQTETERLNNRRVELILIVMHSVLLQAEMIRKLSMEPTPGRVFAEKYFQRCYIVQTHTISSAGLSKGSSNSLLLPSTAPHMSPTRTPKQNTTRFLKCSMHFKAPKNVRISATRDGYLYSCCIVFSKGSEGARSYDEAHGGVRPQEQGNP